jgi:hypothetical protein
VPPPAKICSLRLFATSTRKSTKHNALRLVLRILTSARRSFRAGPIAQHHAEQDETGLLIALKFISSIDLKLQRSSSGQMLVKGR